MFTCNAYIQVSLTYLFLIALAFASAFTKDKATYVPIDKMALPYRQDGTEFKLR